MKEADEIDRFMRGWRLPGEVEEKWVAVRKDLNRLAGSYDLNTLDGGRAERILR
jgi:hypothetical protein